MVKSTQLHQLQVQSSSSDNCDRSIISSDASMTDLPLNQLKPRDSDASSIEEINSIASHDDHMVQRVADEVFRKIETSHFGRRIYRAEKNSRIMRRCISRDQKRWLLDPQFKKKMLGKSKGKLFHRAAIQFFLGCNKRLINNDLTGPIILDKMDQFINGEFTPELFAMAMTDALNEAEADLWRDDLTNEIDSDEVQLEMLKIHYIDKCQERMFKYPANLAGAPRLGDSEMDDLTPCPPDAITVHGSSDNSFIDTRVNAAPGAPSIQDDACGPVVNPFYNDQSNRPSTQVSSSNGFDQVFDDHINRIDDAGASNADDIISEDDYLIPVSSNGSKQNSKNSKNGSQVSSLPRL